MSDAKLKPLSPAGRGFSLLTPNECIIRRSGQRQTRVVSVRGMDATRRPFVDRPLVYVAGPYTSPDPVLNTHLMIEIADRLVEGGVVTPVVPHLTLLWHLVKPRELGFWYEYDLAIVAKCDAVFRVTGPSTGADKEVVFAQSRGIPVFYDEATLLEWAHDQ